MLPGEKYFKLEVIALEMENRQCILMGIMGMARTSQLVKHIAKLELFQRISCFDIYIIGGIKKLLYNDLEINKKIKKGMGICNSLIPILNDYDASDMDTEQADLLVSEGMVYSIVERWFYFIQDLKKDFNNDVCKRMIRFATVPSEFVYDYLLDLYDITSIKNKSAGIEEHPIYERELKIVDDDLKFVKEIHSNSEIEERVYEFMKYKFWE